MLTRGRVTTDGVGPHADLLDEFPYLGAPHPVRVLSHLTLQRIARTYRASP